MVQPQGVHNPARIQLHKCGRITCGRVASVIRDMIMAEGVRQDCTRYHKQEGHLQGKKDICQGAQHEMSAGCLGPHTDILVCTVCGGQRWQKRLSRAHSTCVLWAEGSEIQSRQGAECTKGMENRGLR